MNLIFVVVFAVFLFPGIFNPFASYSLAETLIVAVILAPVIETYLVQGFVLRKTYELSGNSKFLAIVISALVFGLAHIYPSPPVALKAFLAGLLYAILFFSVQKRTKNPLLYVVLAHALYNLSVTVLNTLT